MNSLLDSVLEAHGGLERWRRFTRATAQIVSGGGLWPLKGLTQDPAPRRMEVALDEQYASVHPFGKPEWRTNFRSDRVAIETTAGEILSERLDPRASFYGHTMNTPWDALQRAYFNGYALWTYLNTPFLLALPDVEIVEIEPIAEGDERWRGLRATFPDTIATHCRQQDFYFGDDALLRRHDYRVDVAGSFPAAQYVDGIVEVQGLRMPTRRRAYLRGPDRKAVRDVLMVAIDLVRYEFR